MTAAEHVPGGAASPGTAAVAEPLLEVRGISKRFGATPALTDVGFDIRPGEIHSLTGENGAGKSTLMKIITGNYAPDTGTILVRGQPVTFASPREAQAAGIAIIHQELNTIPEMTVAENLSLGQEPNTFGVLNRRRLVEEAKKKLALVGSDIDPRTPIGRLSVGMQQMVEIARALAEDAQVLVLDEPTAALSQSESARLFALLGKMRERGMGLVYISHRMEELWRLSDRLTVLRDGKFVGTKRMSETSSQEIVSMMVGREINDLYGHTAREIGDVRLEVRDVAGRGGIGPVSFDVRGGEIVSLVGLIGAGRTEVVRMIYGADRATSGQALLDGEPLRSTDPKRSIRDGVALLPESRKEQALFLEQSVTENIEISTLGRHSTFGVTSKRRMRRIVQPIWDSLRVKASSPEIEVKSLSGGNQQKAVLARMLLQQPRLLILDEPTRGVDIGAKSEIYRIIDEIAAGGAAVLIVSSDLPEALGISDRLLVMHEGGLVAELDAEQATEELVMEHATGTFHGDEREA
ncbi:MAG: sugar ABC transporter ATP-binding protein [Microbacterium sp.]